MLARRMPHRGFKLAAAALGVLAAGGLALLIRWVMKPPPECVTCGDCREIYRLNPARRDVGPQGLRDRAYAIPKPPGKKRILLLGDSITYGEFVDGEQTFAKLLERRLGDVEVINAGVPAYSAYNEVEYYLARGRDFAPDLVIVGVCLNDVVDPKTHWDVSLSRPIPRDAVPNPGRVDRGWIGREPPSVVVNGQRYRAFLGGGTDLTIQVWLDPDAPEWRWLRGLYARLRESVRAGGSELAFVIFPFRYQLPPDYPFSPQAEIQRYCGREGFECLDVLPRLRSDGLAGGADPFVDPIHLSPRGHELVAAELDEFLRAHPRLLSR
jgi:lysophospholipase L1-like esterase